MPGKKDNLEMNEEENVAPEADEAAANEMTLSEDELKALCLEHICSTCDVMEQAKEDRLRALADSENFKKRVSRETDELKKFAAENILSDLLPILDNLDLALNHAKDLDACKDFVMGVDMTRKLFLETLSRHGLEAVGKPGEDFDPNFHEAMGMAQVAELADGSVAQVMQRGYVLKGRIIRPAKVMVNKLT
ncbi:nucleotide exchange factor GrpE [Maridesulfovibrio ferrireducens]|uniref:nucleotide exchange factor GrpE n=1 Tax=Maridesulfovibrio ferrireducens TaxID=246191 RepID=UPI001A1E412B|nr:nucleotide exchange factor GrpE [Maridesulfovibrio ferrireducens]MBI9111609.1 nucleotide exchange factor GrpE [Maridesulfovibrio ferrireducens]